MSKSDNATKTIQCEQCGTTAILPLYSSKKFCSPECRFKSIVPAKFDEAKCVGWPKSRNPVTGYGQFNISDRQPSRIIGAHRMAYLVFVGSIDDGLQVLHKCDNRSCVNPHHLFLGSQQENINDMWMKERQQDYKKVLRGNANPSRSSPHKLCRGESHLSSKLTEGIVKEIRASDLSHAELARLHGVSATAISYARQRKTWSHIP